MPDGTPARRYPAVPPAERDDPAARIELVEELLIGERGDDPNYIFGDRTPRIAVDGRGNIYVADTSQQRVLVFDEHGEHIRTLGREGQGPGEFVQPMVAIIAGDAVFVSDTARAHLSKWDLDGELLWDVQLENVFPGYLIAPQLGLADGSWLIRYHLPRTADEVVARMSGEGDFLDPADSPLARRTRITRPERVWYPPRPPGTSRAGQLAFFAGRTPPAFAFAPDGSIYVSTYDEYQILAVGPSGEARWALQVAWPRSPLADVEKAWGVELMRGQGRRGAEASQFEWPDRQFALGDVRADGHGRVYAFPYVPRGARRERLPVDVYSAEGELLLNGSIGVRGAKGGGAMSDLAWPGVWKFGPMLDAAWQVAIGDAVYGVVEDPGTHEWAVVRFQIEWPRDR